MTPREWTQKQWPTVLFSVMFGILIGHYIDRTQENDNLIVLGVAAAFFAFAVREIVKRTHHHDD